MFVNRPLLLKSAIGIGLAFALSGCGANRPYVPYETFKPEKTAEKVKQEAKIDNGAIVTPSGKKIFDDQGDIKYVHTTGNKTYYLLLKRADNTEYLLKDTDNKYKKELKANAIKLYDNGLIAARLNTQHSDVYDNIWQIKADGAELINKNIILSGTPSGVFDIKPLMTKGGMSWYVDGYRIVNLLDGKEVYPNPANSRTLNFETIGAAGENIVILYWDQNGNKAFGTYGGVSGKATTILNEKTYDGSFQILKKDRQIVLKIFDNPSSKHLFVNNDSYEEEANKNKKIEEAKQIKGRYIDLGTMKEVDIKESEFKPILLHNQYVSRITYTIDDVWWIAYDGKILF